MAMRLVYFTVALYIYLKQLLAEQDQIQYFLNDDMGGAIDFCNIFWKNSPVLSFCSNKIHQDPLQKFFRMSQLADLQKFSLNLSSLSFISQSLSSLFLYGLLSLWCFSLVSVNYNFQLSFKLKVNLFLPKITQNVLTELFLKYRKRGEHI